MNSPDTELRELFRRKEPPEGFATRVLARTEGQRRRLNQARAWGWARWLAACAACVLVVVGALQYRGQRRAQRNAEQAALALRIAGSQLDAALQQAARTESQALAVLQKSNRGKEQP
jgi:hypothetical protein